MAKRIIFLMAALLACLQPIVGLKIVRDRQQTLRSKDTAPLSGPDIVGWELNTAESMKCPFRDVDKFPDVDKIGSVWVNIDGGLLGHQRIDIVTEFDSVKCASVKEVVTNVTSGATRTVPIFGAGPVSWDEHDKNFSFYDHDNNKKCCIGLELGSKVTDEADATSGTTRTGFLRTMFQLMNPSGSKRGCSIKISDASEDQEHFELTTNQVCKAYEFARDTYEKKGGYSFYLHNCHDFADDVKDELKRMDQENRDDLKRCEEFSCDNPVSCGNEDDTAPETDRGKCMRKRTQRNKDASKPYSCEVEEDWVGFTCIESKK